MRGGSLYCCLYVLFARVVVFISQRAYLLCQISCKALLTS